MASAPKAVRDVVRQGQYDLVHVHTPVAAFVTRAALRKRRRQALPRVIYTAHGFHFHRGGSRVKNSGYMALEKLAGRWTDALVVINQEDLAAAQRHKLAPSGRIQYMPGIGVDTRRFSPDAVSDAEIAALRQSLGLTPREHLISMVAEFIPRKRHADAIAALAQLGRQDVHLALAGTGPLTSQIKDQAAALHVSSQVHFLGFRNDIPILARASSAVLLPSAQEGLPCSVMEALSLGTPVIGTRIRGVEDLLADGAGLLVEVGDVDALADALRTIVDVPAEAAEMGQRGRAQMAAYDVRHIIQLHDELYASVLKDA